MKFASAILFAFVLSIVGCTGVQSASVTVNPLTMTIGGELVFKDGKWQRVPRAVRDVDPCGNVRAVSPCDAAREVRAETVEIHGLRGLVGPIVSQRGLERAAHVNAKAVREEEKETYRALKEIHDAEMRRIDAVIHATSRSTGGIIRRAFTCAPSTLPTIEATPVPVIDATPIVPSAPQIGDVIVTPPTVIPAPTGTIDDLPPSGIMKNQSGLPLSGIMGATEDRLAKLEKSQKADHEIIVRMDANLTKLMEKK